MCCHCTRTDQLKKLWLNWRRAEEAEEAEERKTAGNAMEFQEERISFCSRPTILKSAASVAARRAEFIDSSMDGRIGAVRRAGLHTLSPGGALSPPNMYMPVVVWRTITLISTPVHNPPPLTVSFSGEKRFQQHKEDEVDPKQGCALWASAQLTIEAGSRPSSTTLFHSVLTVFTHQSVSK